MFGSKPRSESFRSGRKNHPSILSRTFSASRFCSGDPLISQVDSNALKPVEQQPSKVANLSEKQTVRISTTQQHMGQQLEEELKMTRAQLGAVQEQRDRVRDELREVKMVALEGNLKVSDEPSSWKVSEAVAELNTLKESLSKLTQELRMKEKDIESLKLQLHKAKEFEVRLAERDASFLSLNEELSKTRASEACTIGLLSETKRKIQELEDQIEMGKLSEIKMHDTLVSQTKQLERTKIELEELKLETASLRGKIEEEEISHRQSRGRLNGSEENLAQAQEGGNKVASPRTKNLVAEMKSVKSELKLAIEAEDKSKKAMDDLALVLKEVAAEANHAKEKLGSTEMELEHVKQEAEQLKEMVRSTEDRYQKKLDEVHKEVERFKNTAERLRLEAEESLLAWNDKEIGFVNCIKTAEEERTLAQEENMRLIESLKAAEHTSRMSREENFKLRDILKQALNEANVAKEAAEIARAENSQLKDSNVEKDETLDFFTRENERLRINEAAAHESIKELKHLLSMASTKELKTEDKDRESKPRSKTRSMAEEPPEDGKKLNKAFSFNLSELKILNKWEDGNEKVVDDDPIKAEALKGSIFDTVYSPKSEPQTPLHRKVPSSFTDYAETVNSEDLDHLEGSHFGDEENERNLQRKSRALLRRFGDLLKRKSLITIH